MYVKVDVPMDNEVDAASALQRLRSRKVLVERVRLLWLIGTLCLYHLLMMLVILMAVDNNVHPERHRQGVTLLTS